MSSGVSLLDPYGHAFSSVPKRTRLSPRVLVIIQARVTSPDATLPSPYMREEDMFVSPSSLLCVQLSDEA